MSGLSQLSQAVLLALPLRRFDTSPPAPGIPSPCPEKFSGDSGDCGGFLFQCSLAFNQSPHLFRHDVSKIAYILRLLTGRALKWAESRFPDRQQFGCTFSDFVSEFKMVFAAESDETTDSRHF
uniref:DUF4939 domain-containing protein n=1 Tax=Fundulus heteroclitus TaxID=8078 RepID=A0A3Q2PQA1_FUNHE